MKYCPPRRDDVLDEGFLEQGDVPYVGNVESGGIEILSPIFLKLVRYDAEYRDGCAENTGQSVYVLDGLSKVANGLSEEVSLSSVLGQQSRERRLGR